MDRADRFRILMSGLFEGINVMLNGPPPVTAPAVGFALFTWNYGHAGGAQVNYIANADRETMVLAVRAWLAAAEQGEGILFSLTFEIDPALAEEKSA